MRPSQPCVACGAPLEETLAEFLDLRGPDVTILDVPTLVCGACSRCQFSLQAADRLGVILGRAFDHAREFGVEAVQWTFTWNGPPEIGGMPPALKECFATLRIRVALERGLVEAAEQAARAAPRLFH